MTEFVRKTVSIHPSVDKAIRLVQVALLKLTQNYDYSAALNAIVLAYMLRASAGETWSRENHDMMKRFITNMKTELIPDAILEKFEERMREVVSSYESEYVLAC